MQIKFRQAINNPDGSFKKWHYWGLDINGDGEFVGPHSKHRENPSQQFINSRDADGTEIYQGDYLKAPSGTIFRVDWHDTEMRWAMRSIETEIVFNLNCGIMRIVGNDTEGIK